MRKHQLILVYFALIALGIFLLPMANCIKPDSEKSNAPQLVTTKSEKNVDFILPISKGELKAKFGPIKHPIKEGIYNHKGVDIGAESGTEVYAAAEGKVYLPYQNIKLIKAPGNIFYCSIWTIFKLVTVIWILFMYMKVNQ